MMMTMMMHLLCHPAGRNKNGCACCVNKRTGLSQKLQLFEALYPIIGYSAFAFVNDVHKLITYQIDRD